MCCFVLCYFANTKIDESFRTAKIRRTFFGNSLASKFAGCVRKDDFGSGRLRKNRRRKRKTAQFRRAKGHDDPFISRKVLQSHMQFGFGTSAFFCYLCPAIRNSGLSWLNGKIWKIYLSSQVHILFAVQPAPYGMEYGFLRHYGAGYMRLLLQRFSRAVRWVSKQ